MRITNFRNTNIKRLIIGNWNVNSMTSAGKFGHLKWLVQGKVDVLVIAESKLDKILIF